MAIDGSTMIGTYGAKGIWHSGPDPFPETFPWFAIDLVSPQKLRQNKLICSEQSGPLSLVEMRVPPGHLLPFVFYCVSMA